MQAALIFECFNVTLSLVIGAEYISLLISKQLIGYAGIIGIFGIGGLISLFILNSLFENLQQENEENKKIYFISKSGNKE